jgi:hypothetical protein
LNGSDGNLHTFEINQDWFLYQLFQYFVRAFPLDHSGSPVVGGFERILNGTTDNPFYASNLEEYCYLYQVRPDLLSLRISKTINTYWMAAMFGYNLGASLDPSTVGFDSALTVYNTTVVVEKLERFFACNRAWLSALMVATFVMIFTSFVNLVLNLVRQAPLSTDFLTALTKGHFDQTRIQLASYLDSETMSARLTTTRIKIGDGRPMEETGKIVIGQSEFTETLRDGRVYR